MRYTKGVKVKDGGIMLKTQLEFERDVEKLNNKLGRDNGEYEVRGRYLGANKEIEMYHKVCDKTYITKPTIVLRGVRCKNCFGKRERTDAEFDKEVEELNVKKGRPHDEYLFLEEYKGSKKKIRVLHNKKGCLREYKTQPYDFLRGYGCAYCSGNVKKTNWEFLKEVETINENRSGDKEEYVFLEEYKGTNTSIKVMHTKCGTEYKTIPKNFLKGAGCRKCQGTMKKTNEEFIKEIIKLVGEEYTFLDEYENTQKKIRVRHNTCGYEYKVSPKRFIHGELRCLKCTGYYRRSEDEFRQEVLIKRGGEFEVVGEYTRVNDNIEIRHKRCGKTFLTRGTDILRKAMCIHCSYTKGEQEVGLWLEELGVTRESEYKLLRNAGTNYWLRVDFALIGERGELEGVIEYDGVQHYEPVDFFGGEEGLKKSKERDKMKDDYCRANNIPLLRIPYWEFKNIRSITEDFVEKIKTGLNN